MDFPTLQWIGDVDGHLRLIDQTQLPVTLVEIDCHDVPTVVEAIKSLRVRGAPAIGIAAAYGVCLGLQSMPEGIDDAWRRQFAMNCQLLAESRPTAVNLCWALDRMQAKLASIIETASAQQVAETLLAEARAIHQEDRAMCREIGRHGAELLSDGDGVLTHCNAGGLATSDYGTALALFYAAHEQGKQLAVYADETRPLLQGSRLTAWELARGGLDVTVICDSMAAQVMREGKVQAVVTGADRIAANGDVANKIGTYSVALVAKAHDIPFYVAAPSSTFDLSLESGAEIPIEYRDPREITNGFGKLTAPENVKVYNPAFDVTPAELVTALICERGVIRPVNGKQIARMLA